jgi:hypothetical protein
MSTRITLKRSGRTRRLPAGGCLSFPRPNYDKPYLAPFHRLGEDPRPAPNTQSSGTVDCLTYHSPSENSISS